MANQGGGSAGGGDDKQSNTLLYVIFGLMAIGAAIWYFFQMQLKWAYIFIRRYEALIISLFTDKIKPLLGDLARATPLDLTAQNVTVINNYIGHYLRYPTIFIILILGIMIFKGHRLMRFTKTYNMESLMQQEQKNWPQIAPVVNLDLMSEDITTGPWAMAMNPMQFCKHYKLLDLEMVGDRKAAWRGEGTVKATVKEEKAIRVFTNQLGPLWEGPHKLPPHTKALYAAFLARIEHDTPATRAYLNKLALSAAKGDVDYSDTEDLINKYYKKSKPAQLVEQRHAYVLTVMAEMLELARVDGVLASADFLWIKPVDRRLWYILNTVGRQVAVCEIAGAYAHWLAEKQLLRPLNVPVVTEAINALKFAVSNAVYVPDDDEKIPIAGEKQASQQ